MKDKHLKKRVRQMVEPDKYCETKVEDVTWLCSLSEFEIDRNMEANAASHEQEDQDEYVLLDLDGVSNLINLPPNANYVLTGLDTLNPVLIIDDKFKLIGEYEETIGTCLAFTEQDTLVVHEETGSSEVNLFSGTRLIDSSQPPTKQVKLLCQLHKVLKFKLSPDSEIQSVTLEELK
ncbi:unnamed protein product [Sphenostylis stenocarpa]|uniref:Transcription factor TFIIIC triple barrel domain-containing protein n=1 Tax=Sphenostylis stenocarpa TaxID=92480 RepID=A0AA86VEM8_9FABA|nr:unnamed protein product [Sphenostylis stenocarpa]